MAPDSSGTGPISTPSSFKRRPVSGAERRTTSATPACPSGRPKNSYPATEASSPPAGPDAGPPAWPYISGTGRSLHANNQVIFASSTPRTATNTTSNRLATMRAMRSCTCTDKPATSGPSGQQRLPDPEDYIIRACGIRPGLSCQLPHAFVHANPHHAIAAYAGIGCWATGTLLGDGQGDSVGHGVQVCLHGREPCLAGVVTHGPGDQPSGPTP